MDIRQLTYFIYVADTLNITHAALRANVSQPALSRQMRMLENELSLELFARKARGIVLTEAGHKFAEHARRLIADVNRTKAEMNAEVGTPVGSLRIAASNSLCTMLTTRVIGRYRRSYPRVDIHVEQTTSMNTRAAILDNRAEVGLISGRELREGLQTRYLVTEDLCLVGPPDAKLTLERPVSSQDLREIDLILTPFPNGIRRAIDELLMQAGRVFDPKIEVDTRSLMTALVTAGEGYCILPLSGIQDLLERVEVSAAPIAGQSWTWVAAVSQERPMRAAAQRFVEIVIDEIDELISSDRWSSARYDEVVPGWMDAKRRPIP